MKAKVRIVLLAALAVWAVGIVWLCRQPTVAPHPAPSVSASAPVSAPQSIEERLKHYDAQDAWLKRRDLEFDKCDALHGTPTLGFGMRVVCLDSRVVLFLGEEHPPYETK